MNAQYRDVPEAYGAMIVVLANVNEGPVRVVPEAVMVVVAVDKEMELIRCTRELVAVVVPMVDSRVFAHADGMQSYAAKVSREAG